MDIRTPTCPSCHGHEVKRHTLYETKNHGQRVVSKCIACERYFPQTSNTFLAGIKKPISLVIKEVLSVRNMKLPARNIPKPIKISATVISTPITAKLSTPLFAVATPLSVERPTLMLKIMEVFREHGISTGLCITLCGFILPPKKFQLLLWESSIEGSLGMNFSRFP